jgi:nucleoside-diphosphate-sugar epimerase
MKCFVTGAAGYIGNALVERLISEGHSIIGLIHHSYPKKPVDNVTYIYGDITNKESFSSYITDVDIVFHCAAYVKDHGKKKVFYDINVKGTEQLVDALKDSNIKQFIFLSHLPYESSFTSSPYSQSKQIAEMFLQHIHKKTGFPITIIHPGNVYGPGETIWVKRPIEAICKNRLIYIDHGNGIFLHTYIDNLLDGLLLCMNEPRTIGNTILITDGDNSITWKTYFNDLASILGKKQTSRSISKRSARILGYFMEKIFPPFGFTPWVTPFSVDVLSNMKPFFLNETKEVINFRPTISYKEAMKQIEIWINEVVTC